MIKIPYFRAEDGEIIHYTDQGQGRPIILIHGYGCDHSEWFRNTPELAKNHRVIEFDFRGHGFTGKEVLANCTLAQSAKDVKLLIDKLSLDECILVGHSTGTHVIYNYLNQFGGEKLKGVCFIDMSPKLVGEKGWEHHMAGLDNEVAGIGFLKGFFQDPLETAHQFYGFLYANDKDFNSDPYLQPFNHAFEASYQNMTIDSRIAIFLDLLLGDWRQANPKISVPVLLTYGAKSTIFPSEKGKYQHETIPNSTLVLFENCGHSPNAEEPDRWNAELIKFTNSL